MVQIVWRVCIDAVHEHRDPRGRPERGRNHSVDAAKAEVLADEGVVNAAKRGVEKRAAMDRIDDGGHEFVGQVHDHGVVEESKAPGPLGCDTCGQIDKRSGDQEEGKIKRRESTGEAGRADTVMQQI